MTKRKKTKSTDAWKDLVKRYKKGPKRVRLTRKRRPADHTPATDLSQSKTVQLVSKERYGSTKNIIVLLYKERFRELNLQDGKTYTTNAKTPFKAAKTLQPALKNMSHNDIVLKKVKLEKYAGKCIVFAGISKNPDATIHYIPEQNKTPTISKHFKESDSIVRTKEEEWEEL